MQEESRRKFLMRYAAMALAACDRAARAQRRATGARPSRSATRARSPRTSTARRRSPYPTLHPQRTPPVALYGPPPSPYPTVDPQRPPPPAPVYGPPPRNPLD